MATSRAIGGVANVGLILCGFAAGYMLASSKWTKERRLHYGAHHPQIAKPLLHNHWRATATTAAPSAKVTSK